MYENMEQVREEIASLSLPALVGISGFAGAGKTTFARQLGMLLSAPVVCVDDFGKSATMREYNLWDVMDYERLEREVICPFLGGEMRFSYGVFDWEQNSITHVETREHQGILIVEGVGLFRPTLLSFFTQTFWLDCPLAVACNQGKKRDQKIYGHKLDEFWEGLWRENDENFFEVFSPRACAGRVVKIAEETGCRFQREGECHQRDI